jgi:hypothetical protein
MQHWRTSLHVLVPAASILTALAVAGCAPPYIEDLNKAAGLVNQMMRVGTVGPVDVDPNGTSVRFLPPRPTASAITGVNFQSGFLIVGTAGQDRLSFINGSSVHGSQTFTTSGAVTPYPANQFDVSNTLSNAASIVVSTFDGTSTSTYQQYTATLPDGTLTAVNSPQLYSAVFGGGLTVLGAWEVPGAPAALDTWIFLVNPPGSYGAGIVAMDGSAVTFPPTGTYALLPPGFSPPSRCLYYFSIPTGAGVASYYVAGAWSTFQWFGTGTATAMNGVAHRIDAVISTGDYLSAEGGMLRLYDPSGTGAQVVSMDLRGLQFCYEAYVGSSPYVFFVLPMKMNRGRYAFTVYAIPSSAMRGLKG